MFSESAGGVDKVPSPLGTTRGQRERCLYSVGPGRSHKGVCYGHQEIQFFRVTSFKRKSITFLTHIHRATSPHTHTYTASDLICQLQIKTGFKLKTKFHGPGSNKPNDFTPDYQGNLSYRPVRNYLATRKGEFLWCHRT